MGDVREGYELLGGCQIMGCLLVYALLALALALIAQVAQCSLVSEVRHAHAGRRSSGGARLLPLGCCRSGFPMSYFAALRGGGPFHIGHWKACVLKSVMALVPFSFVLVRVRAFKVMDKGAC
jgi:hypothetical protein